MIFREQVLLIQLLKKSHVVKKLKVVLSSLQKPEIGPQLESVQYICYSPNLFIHKLYFCIPGILEVFVSVNNTIWSKCETVSKSNSC
jgi:hypothetical protein